MKKSMKILALVAAFAAMIVAQAYAHPGAGWGPKSDYGRMYNLKTVETVTGAIVSVEKISETKARSYGIHAGLKTSAETIAVHLGPAWYIENQEETLTAGDKVTITGSRITYEGKPAIIAAKVKKGEATLVLRDKGGYPVWSGWRKKM